MTKIERAFITFRAVPSVGGYGALGLTLAAAWGISFVAGGSSTAFPHLFYIPILIAAARGGWLAAGCTSVLAGMLAGPALPLNVGAGSSQRPADWLARLLLFVLIGQVTAWLSTRTHPTVQTAADLWKNNVGMRRALERDEFLIYYQPIVDLATERVVGAEALLRWRRPDYGLLQPSSFLPAAEESGVIVDIGARVLLQAATQTAAWQEIVGYKGLTVAVNISARHLDGERLIEDVTKALDSSGLEARCLHLELTETALLVNVDAAAAVLTQVRKLGVEIAVDDFGIQQSSLSYLQRLPLDAVKVDRAFVMDIGLAKAGGSIAAGVIGLADALGMSTVAEGVEHAHQAAALAAYGCHKAQGFYFGRPMPTEEFTALLRSSRSGDVSPVPSHHLHVAAATPLVEPRTLHEDVRTAVRPAAAAGCHTASRAHSGRPA